MSISESDTMERILGENKCGNRFIEYNAYRGLETFIPKKLGCQQRHVAVIAIDKMPKIDT
jgi:hypothetical protein